jgi:transposase-like protein
MHEDATQGLESPATTEKRLNRGGIRVVCRDCDFEDPRWHPDLEAFEGARHGHDLRTDHEVAYEATNDRVRTDGGQVEACPACDSSRINRRVSDRFDADERYRCVECHATFPDPVLRPSRRPEACGYTETYHALTDANDLDDLRADGSGETVDACPECDSGRLTKHVGGMSRPIDGPLGYRCLDCKAKFEEPVTRPSRGESPNVGNLSEAGRALLDADPDDFEIRTDGGRDELAMAIDRQTDVLERLVDETAYQNAVLSELAHATWYAAVAESEIAHPDEKPEHVPSLRGLLRNIEDQAFTREEDR